MNIVLCESLFCPCRLSGNKIEKWKWGMCQRDNNSTKEHTTAKSHQWVFNAAETPTSGGVLQLAPMLVSKKYVNPGKIANIKS